MCTISQKIKLCTCTSFIENLNHYWVLYCLVNDKDEVMMGEPVMPANIDPGKDKFNSDLLLKLLNDGNVFDEPLYPVEKDRLQLTFTINDKGPLHYGFIYETKEWHSIEFDYFDWSSQHDEIQKGKIKNALKRGND